MEDDVRCLIEAIEKRFIALREADLEAVRLRHQELSTRMEGFPQEFARKAEMAEASKALQKLERDSIARELYETNHKALVDLVQKMERDKMDETVFTTFVENYRISMDNAATERRAVAAALAASTERRAGASATWKQIAGVIATAVAVATVVISLVVLIASHAIR